MVREISSTVQYLLDCRLIEMEDVEKISSENVYYDADFNAYFLVTALQDAKASDNPFVTATSTKLRWNTGKFKYYVKDESQRNLDFFWQNENLR